MQAQAGRAPEAHVPGESSAAQPITGYRLNCAHQEARDGLTAWLDGTRLPWPGHFTLDVTVGDCDPFPADTRESFRQPNVLIQGGPPDGVLRVTWEGTPAVVVIHETKPEARLWLSPSAVANLPNGERSFLLTMLVFLMRRIGWFHVHGASMIDTRERGWLIAGSSHSGKSTTTALMAMSGWKISTDDMAFLARHDDHIVAFGIHSRIALRPGGQALLGKMGGTVLQSRNKEGFWAEELGSEWVSSVRPQLIAFPTLGEQTAMKRAVPRYALSNILLWSHWALYEPGFAQEQLDLLATVAAQSRCYDLTLGIDLFERPELLEKLAS